MMFDSEFISLNEALSKLDRHLKTMDSEKIHIRDSYGRVLAQTIISHHDIPPFDKSSMDGYALIAEDSLDDSIESFKIIDRIGAGSFSTKTLNHGEAIVIATGAPIPDGADAVVMKELTSEEGDFVKIDSKVQSGDNIHKMASDIAEGEEILASNTIIRYQEMELIATSGYAEIEVYKRPKVKLIVTGNELVEPSKHLDKAKIVNSNQFTISAMIESAGADVDVTHCHDSLEELCDAILEAKDYDIVITTGGTAISKGDVSVNALDDLGELLFHGVAINPGRLIGAGVIGDSLVFNLSGRPGAAMLQFDVFVRYCLFKIQGLDYIPAIVKRQVNENIRSRKGRTNFIKANSDDHCVNKVLNRKSSVVSSMTEANSYIVIGDDEESLEKGDYANVILFRDFLWPTF